MKSILYLFPSLNPGGAEKASIDISNSLVKSGNYSITYIVLDDSDYLKQYVNNNIIIIQKRIAFSRSRFINILKSVVLPIFYLSQELKKNKYDFIISVYEYDGELPIILYRIINKKIIKGNRIKLISFVQNHLSQIRLNKDSFLSKIKFVFIDYMRSKTFNNIVCVTQAIFEELKPGKTNTMVIPNPINVNKIYNLANEKLADELGNKMININKYFINVGRITVQKNQLLLLEAFNLIKDKCDLNLIIIGAPNDKKLLVELNEFINKENLNNRVIYLGTPQNPYSLIKNAAALVTVSLFEGLPLSILEAFVLKVPVITTKFIGSNSLITNNNSVIIERYSAALIADTLLKFLSGDFDNNEMVDNAFEQVNQHRVEKVLEQYEYLLSS